ncbi:DUF1707 domain-containing protein [Streptomyces sp. TRM 70351]|uniref:DUF1707 SHOCT-like domain-containing protein n=1 Tax=Streptomyces sp. TRM 70351 TaxID=3116552 RepID=UPI002E7B7409|nr:DUF1707 domain-containing protein [Streptomyces sp. TRM 70351]MEE1926979.1 DUF1707 domain-containing protein [Streptomyces sp. TRM 70351]
MSEKLPELRASDAERDQVAEVLREALAEGRLDTDEFGQRLEAVYAARTRGELAPLVRDLPGGTEPARRETEAPARRWSGRFGGTPTSRGGLALMGAFVRKGPWVAPRTFTAVAFWGGGEIDLRDASFEDREVVIRAHAVMGGVHIIVPHDAEVLVGGLGVMGGFDHDATGAGVPGAPRITVTGFAFWGGVTVERKPREGTADDDGSGSCGHRHGPHGRH